MLNQMGLIEAARLAITKREQRAEVVSYYRVSKELGLTSAYMSHLREGRGVMSADVAHRLAVLAEIDPGYAMACIEAERAERSNSETSGTWRVIAESLASHIAGIFCAVILSALAWRAEPVFSGEKRAAVDAHHVALNIHYAKDKNFCCRLATWLKRATVATCRLLTGPHFAT